VTLLGTDRATSSAWPHGNGRIERGGTVIRRVRFRRAAVADLRPGLHSAQFGDERGAHPALRNGFSVESDDDIRRLAAVGVPSGRIDPDRPTVAPAATEIASAAAPEGCSASPLLARPSPSRPRTPLALEMPRARQIYPDAQRLLRELAHNPEARPAMLAASLPRLVNEIVASVLRNPDALLLATAIRAGDEYTFQHSLRTCVLMVAWYRFRGLPRPEVDEAALGALLHDVGKLRVPEQILTKPGRLTDAEFAAMKEHPGHGAMMLDGITSLTDVTLAMVRQHHERIDGKGYPDGRTGAQIHPAAQMCGIVDVYDALTADRCYRKAIAPTEALAQLLGMSNRSFDAVLVHSFIHTVGIYPVGSVVRLDDGMLAFVVGHNDESSLRPQVRVFYDAMAQRQVSPYDLDLSAPGTRKVVDSIVIHDGGAQLGTDLRALA
jgi:HD-GYP domain-containing protein (c-di-GMP phosphodiesterase class II)